jgi:vancomycin permeability regulator SanA
VRIALAALGALGLTTGVANAEVVTTPDGGLATVEAPEVILILAGGIRGDGPSPILEDRLTTALELYRAGAAPKLLLTGDRFAGETQVMRDWLLERGVPKEALVVDDDGVNTYSSMLRARDVFGIKRAVVVTQRFHLPRALYIARTLGVGAVGVEAAEVRYTGDLRHPAREFLARPAAIVDCARGRAAGRRGWGPTPPASLTTRLESTPPLQLIAHAGNGSRT